MKKMKKGLITKAGFSLCVCIQESKISGGQGPSDVAEMRKYNKTLDYTDFSSFCNFINKSFKSHFNYFHFWTKKNIVSADWDRINDKGVINVFEGLKENPNKKKLERKQKLFKKHFFWLWVRYLKSKCIPRWYSSHCSIPLYVRWLQKNQIIVKKSNFLKKLLLLCPFWKLKNWNGKRIDVFLIRIFLCFFQGWDFNVA